MNYNKYDARGKLITQRLSSNMRAELTIKALWSLKVKPLLWAISENLFYGLVFGTILSVLCLIGGFIFFTSDQYQNSVKLMALINGGLLWFFAFVVGYLFKITTSGNWLNTTVKFSARAINKFKFIIINKKQSKSVLMEKTNEQ